MDGGYGMGKTIKRIRTRGYDQEDTIVRSVSNNHVILEYPANPTLLGDALHAKIPAAWPLLAKVPTSTTSSCRPGTSPESTCDLREVSTSEAANPTCQEASSLRGRAEEMTHHREHDSSDSCLVKLG